MRTRAVLLSIALSLGVIACEEQKKPEYAPTGAGDGDGDGDGTRDGGGGGDGDGDGDGDGGPNAGDPSARPDLTGPLSKIVFDPREVYAVGGLLAADVLMVAFTFDEPQALIAGFEGPLRAPAIRSSDGRLVYASPVASDTTVAAFVADELIDDRDDYPEEAAANEQPIGVLRDCKVTTLWLAPDDDSPFYMCEGDERVRQIGSESAIDVPSGFTARQVGAQGRILSAGDETGLGLQTTSDDFAMVAALGETVGLAAPPRAHGAGFWILLRHDAEDGTSSLSRAFVDEAGLSMEEEVMLPEGDERVPIQCALRADGDAVCRHSTGIVKLGSGRVVMLAEASEVPPLLGMLLFTGASD